MNDQKTLAIDIGGTRIKMAVVQAGNVEKFTVIPSYSEGTLRSRLNDIEHAARELTENKWDAYRGVGIAMPCLVDPAKKRATEIYSKFEDASQIDMAKWCHEKFDLPMIMEQDSKAAILGEVYFGCAKGCQDAVMIIMGTGVGTAVMLNGTLLDSRNHSAGSLGSHIIIEMNGRKCTCHSRGCLEAYTSGWALPGIIREHPAFQSSVMKDSKQLDFLSLENAVLLNDEVAKDVLHTVVVALRTGIINMIHAYDPETVILSGGPLHIGDRFTRPLFENMNDVIWGNGKPVNFAIANKPDESVLLGLHYLVTRGGGRGSYGV